MRKPIGKCIPSPGRPSRRTGVRARGPATEPVTDPGVVLAAVMARVLLGVLKASRVPEPEDDAVCADRHSICVLTTNHKQHPKSEVQLSIRCWHHWKTELGQSP